MRLEQQALLQHRPAAPGREDRQPASSTKAERVQHRAQEGRQVAEQEVDARMRLRHQRMREAERGEDRQRIGADLVDARAARRRRTCGRRSRCRSGRRRPSSHQPPMIATIRAGVSSQRATGLSCGHAGRPESARQCRAMSALRAIQTSGCRVTCSAAAPARGSARPADGPQVQPDRHHLRRRHALPQQLVEGADAVASKNPRPARSPSPARSACRWCRRHRAAPHAARRRPAPAAAGRRHRRPNRTGTRLPRSSRRVLTEGADLVCQPTGRRAGGLAQHRDGPARSPRARSLPACWRASPSASHAR